jgi:hypothetical protein
MSNKTQVITSGMLRSLDTFGAGRQDQRIIEESKTLSSTTPREQMRDRWVRVGQYLGRNARLLHERG